MPVLPPSRPVTWRTLILTAVLLLLLMTGLAAAAGWWAWNHLVAQVALKEQKALIKMPEQLAVRAAVSNRVQVTIDERLPVRVPISQALSIPITEPIPIKVAVDTTVPIDLEVPVKHVLKVDQAIDLDAKVQTRVLGFNVTLPIKGRVPLRADVPVDLVIPVRKQIPVSLNMPAVVRLPEPLRAQVDTVFETTIPIKQALSLPVTAPVDATLTFPGQVVEAGLQLVRLDLPFDAIRVLPREAPRWWPQGWPVAGSVARGVVGVGGGEAQLPASASGLVPAASTPSSSQSPVGGEGLKLRGQ
ncbi:MAG: hypothetical protein WAQ08_17570 [Aquabacterium sp.]|jgi:hypothetical protein|uniref:hypothetical protein n=1 Tax=Aquabacterium sp. TaxID=1872578 RepID=UPI003BAFC482